MKSDWLDIDYFNFRYDFVKKLFDDIDSLMDDINDDDDEENFSDWDDLNLLNWSLDDILNMMDAERHFIKIANEISDSNTKYLIQVHLYNFIKDTFYETVEKDLDIFKTYIDEDYEYEDTGKMVLRYIKTLDALLKTYEEIYLI